MSRTIELGGVDPRPTLKPFGVFPSDPTHRWWPDAFARAVLTPVGPGTVRFRWSTSSPAIDVDAWGPGADWLLDAAPGWLGLHDSIEGFDPTAHRRLSELWRRHGSFRLGASGVIWQELVYAILGQRVTTEDAAASWRRMCLQWGEPAPGPCELRLPPSPASLASRSYVDLHRLNVERRRADAILLAARRAQRLEEAAAMPVTDAIERLTALPGLGMWTATVTVTSSHADPDTVILGDYGLPTLVSYALTGASERVQGDDRMLELLAPFAGHRWRVVRLLYNAGVEAPRRAPRAHNPRIDRL